ncbi:MAG: DUF4982 domain-containing protein [Prevotellaceae bacterium]|nr:DUF4982 domain-containing protein [Candidatus Minthosoma caballi]
MKYLSFVLAFCLFTISLHAQRKQSLDCGWKFHRGSVINPEMDHFDDSKWRDITVPHDFSMEPALEITDYRKNTPAWNDVQVGPFSRLSIGDWDTGQTVGGEGWYRRTFTLPIHGSATVDTYLSQQNATLRFDGVYNQAEVWVNGKKAAMNVYGYMPFEINLNEILKDKSCRDHHNEREVTVVVKAVNEGLNSRWYAGSGIFRHVWLESTDKLHLHEWDTFIDGSELLGRSGKPDANVKIFTKVYNDDLQQAKGSLVVNILDAEGSKVATVEKEFTALGIVNDGYSKDGVNVETEVLVKAPNLWSVDKPYRYTARVSIVKNGEERDVLSIPFGIRKIEFSAANGFKLNGQPLKLRGGCVHHDNGLLGAAGIDRADIRKVQLMKAQGYNAVRCSHNLPTEAFLNACDSLGMLVIDEVFDQWEQEKRSADYSHYFSKEKTQIVDGEVKGMGITNFEYDAALMVRRDRNHPSIIMWSIGNEIAQRADLPRGKEIALAINLAINNQDPTRPTTMAVNSFWDRPSFTWENDSHRAFDNVEIAGYNYEWQHYEADHDSFPDRIIYGSESYPKELAKNWQLVEKHPYVIGDFVWTAVDYLGEAGIGCTFERSDNRWFMFMSWPWFNAWCGDLDLVGVKKPQSYYRDIVWGNKPIDMAIRPSVPDGEHEFISGWGWTAEERHWNWRTAASTPQNADKTGKKRSGNSSLYLPIELRPENYLTANLPSQMKHDINAHRSDSLQVNVYSREQRVRLLVNDSIMGEKDINPDTYTATFTVAYEPGQIKAEVVSAKQKGKEEPASVHFNTALAPASISFAAVDSVITSSHNDLAYIYINVLDEEGNLCPTAELPLTITTSGAKHIALAGTGHPYDMHSFRSLTPTTFRGQALLIIQPQEEAGDVVIKVTSPGIPSAEYVVTLQERK